MKQRTTLVVSLAFALLLAACGGDTTSTTTTAAQDTTTTAAQSTTTTVATPVPDDRRDELVVVQAFDMLGFDPTQFASGNHMFMYHVYDTLVRVDPATGLPVAVLAEGWDVSSDGLTVTFQLREGPTFHNGRVISSEDLVFTYDYTIDPDNGTNLGARLRAAVESVEATDDRTIAFTLLRPAPGFFDLMDVFFILNEDTIDTILETGAGSGPYTVDSVAPGESFSLLANPAYWDEGAPVTERIVVRVIADREAQLAALQAGQVDLIYQAAPVLAVQIEGTEGYEVLRFSLGADNPYVGLNVTRPPFDNKLVRQAVAHAIDRAAILAVSYPGGTAEVACQPFPPTSFWHTEGLNDELPTCQFNLDRARELLSEAGFPDGFSTTINVSGNYGPAGTPDMAQILQQDLAEIGIDLEILVIEGAQAREQLLASDFDMVIHTYSSSGADPGFNHPSRTFGPVEPNNAFMQFTSPEYFDMVRSAGPELDRDRRKELFAEMSRLIADEAFINLAGHSYILYLSSDRVSGIVETLSGYPNLSRVAVANP